MFKTVGHFFATVFQKALTVIPQIQSTEATVEAVTANVPVYGPMALPIEKAGYAILGELAAVLHAGGAAASVKLADAGLDSTVIATVQDLLKSIPQFTALVKTL
jgi:hypothetical protein